MLKIYVYVLEGTQPIIFEDGTTMYISHEPPASKFDSGLETSALSILNDLPAIAETEVRVPSVSSFEFGLLSVSLKLIGLNQTVGRH